MYVNSFLPAPAVPPRASSSASLCEVAAKLFSACPNVENPFFSPESVKQFKQHLVTQQLPKGAIVVLDAEVSKKLFYLRSGICRIFQYNDDGKDVTSWFISKNEFFLPAVKAARVTDSLEYMEILEKAELVTLCAHQLEVMYQEHAELNLFGRLLKGQMLARCEERIRFLQIHKAQDRFRDFERQHAALPSRVPLKHIASFLNLTPSTLSRLRASPGQ